MRWPARPGNEDSDIEQLFLPASSFCPLLTGLVRLAHLVLDQGLWEGGGTNGTGRGWYLIWVGWKGSCDASLEGSMTA